MSRAATLLPDGRRLVVDAVAFVLALLLAGLVHAAVAGPDGGDVAALAALLALYLVPAQLVQAVLGQLVVRRIRSGLLRTLATLATWAVVLAGMAFLLPILDPSDWVGSAALVVPSAVALLAVARGGLVLVLDLDRRAGQAEVGPL